MNNRILLTLLLIAVGAVIFMYCQKPPGVDQRLIKLDRRYIKVIDSLQNAYNELITKKDSAAFQAFKSAQEAANRYEAESIIWKRLYEAQKKRKTAILSSGSYDSILTVLYPGQP